MKKTIYFLIIVAFLLLPFSVRADTEVFGAYVSGPSSSTDGYFPQWDGITGHKLKGGVSLSSLGGIPFTIATGVADTITATYSPAITLTNGIIIVFEAIAANATTTPSFNPNGLGALTIVKKGGAALVAGDIPGENAVCILEYNLAHTRWELLNPAFPQTTISGNAGTATALAADPANCAAGSIALGITAAGVAECTATPSGLTSVGATTFTGALTGTASGNIANSVITAAGDVVVGSGVGAATVIAKGAANTFFGVNASDVQGYYANNSFSNSAALVYDVTDPTKFMWFDPSGMITGKTLKIKGSSTTSVTLDVVIPSLADDTKTLTLTFPGTLTANYTFPTATSTLLSSLSASITSATLLGALSDETGTGVAVFNNTPTLISPVLGTATGSSLIVTGIVDGLTNISVNTDQTTIAVGGAGILQGIYLNKHATPATAILYNLPVASAGQQFIIKNSQGAGGANTGAITVHPVAGTTINNVTIDCAVTYTLVSNGAAGDYIAIVGVDATHWEVVGSKGTWTCTVHP